MKILPDALAIEADLAQLLEEAQQAARAAGRPVWAAYVTPAAAGDPIAVFASAHDAPRFFWATPGRTLTLAATGASHTIAPSGPEPLKDVRDALNATPLIVHSRLPLPHGAGPLFVGASAFRPGPVDGRWSPWAGFPNALFTLPEFTYAKSGTEGWLTQTVAVAPGDDLRLVAERAALARRRVLAALYSSASHLAPPAARASQARRLPFAENAAQLAAWRESVRSVAAAARAGRVEKAVLARCVRVPMPAPLDVARLVAALLESHPQSFVFSVSAGAGHRERHFIGATPERLLAVTERRVLSAALAGTTRRGADAAEDGALARELFASTKERHEHELVRRWLLERLGPACSRLDAPDCPGVLRFPNVQHLFTPVEGVLRAPTHILDLVARVHPTPAVGGTPLDEALRLIAAHEPVDRGWYAGPVGWVNPAGEGEFAVGIRSAILDASGATLFAGCGIVADSDPARELEESRLKLNVMLEALERALP